jgi:hypothetical protein
MIPLAGLGQRKIRFEAIAGVAVPLSKLVSTDFSQMSVQNNRRPYFNVAGGVRISGMKSLKKRWILDIINLPVGMSELYLKALPCPGSNYQGFYLGESGSSSASNFWRFNFYMPHLILKHKENPNSKFRFYDMWGIGLELNDPGGNVGQSTTSAKNACGEDFVLTEPDRYNVKKVGLYANVALVAEVGKSNGYPVSFTFFYNQGLVKRFNSDFVYSTASSTEVTTLACSGTNYGLVASFPLFSFKLKEKSKTTDGK